MDPQRLSTGIAELDASLHGGFIRGRSYLVTGDAGTGKTVACLQFLRNALQQGEKAVYVTVDERPAEILESAASFSWDLQRHIQGKDLLILDASPYFGARSAGGGEKGIDPQKIVADLGSYARRLAATILIIDPITPLVLPSDPTSQDLTRSLVQLIHSQFNTTNLFTAHLAPSPADLGAVGAIEFLASGVLVLENRARGGKYQRTLRIKKMRGTAVASALYSFAFVGDRGIVLLDGPGPTESALQKEPDMFELFDLSEKP
ncbi:MAG TPA: ATPase domain-containing protein [Methylomirabilota bacterium]|nr:ATPase domain-containing protein [Methylomirabilota bacterium]